MTEGQKSPAVQQQAESAVNEKWILAKETVVDIPGHRPDLGYTVMHDAQPYNSRDEVFSVIASKSLPLGWVCMKLSQSPWAQLFAAPPQSPEAPAGGAAPAGDVRGSNHKIALDVLEQHASNLDTLSRPFLNTITQFSADQNAAHATALRKSIDALTRADEGWALAAKWRKKCAELRYPGMTGEVKANAAGAAPAQPEVGEALIEELERAVLAKSLGLDPYHKRLPAAREAIRAAMKGQS